MASENPTEVSSDDKIEPIDLEAIELQTENDNNGTTSVNFDNASSKTTWRRSKPKQSLVKDQSHRLRDKRSGQSQVEQLAFKIEDRKANRIPITWEVRIAFLTYCGDVKEAKGYEGMKIHQDDLVEYRELIRERREPNDGENGTLYKIKMNYKKTIKFFGFYDRDERLSKILDKACEEQDKVASEWFYYGDFNYFFTKDVPTWPLFRNEIKVAIFSLLLFYIATPVLFCAIMKNEGICPSDPRVDKDRSYYGWVSALYFASTTMSTVGYGDLSVFNVDERPERWEVFIGTAYMLLSMVVTILFFGAAADNAFKPFGNWEEKLLNFTLGRFLPDTHIWQRLRWVRIVKITQIVLAFFIVNFIGMVAMRIFVRNAYEFQSTSKWTWMDAFYWSVQTTTTIGYGDLDMSFNMRWFQIFYLLISTYAAGSILGDIGSLKTEMRTLRAKLVWESRETSKNMIEDMQAYDNHDDKVDQFEFVLSSLVTLGKVSYDDINHIMDKFRTLENNGYITISDTLDDEPNFSLTRGGPGGLHDNIKTFLNDLKNDTDKKNNDAVINDNGKDTE